MNAQRKVLIDAVLAENARHSTFTPLEPRDDYVVPGDAITIEPADPVRCKCGWIGSWGDLHRHSAAAVIDLIRGGDVWVVTRGDSIHGYDVEGVAADAESRDALMKEASERQERYHGGGNYWQIETRTDDHLSLRNGAGCRVHAQLMPLRGEAS